MESVFVLQQQAEAKKQTVRHMLERLSAGDVSGFTECLAPNYRRHSQAMPPNLQEIRGRKMMHDWLLSSLVPFPDYHEELEWVVVEGDLVAWRSRAKGTQSGPLGPFPPTNKPMDIVILGMHRFEGGLVAETWTSWDNLAVLTQLGHMRMAG
jgi:predicted ester cyclase